MHGEACLAVQPGSTAFKSVSSTHDAALSGGLPPNPLLAPLISVPPHEPG